ncbi:MAG: NADH-quinone oxidoreductase subunit B family protein [Candidatus Methanomethylicia archaeon]|nr:NADH-quinone oxidoreductase subunit B family protein [Candidatus Methanomethylicia archaeon]
MTLKSTSRKNAIHVMLFYSGGCNGCDIEVVNALLSPRYDLEQYGILLTWNPREADVLIVSGVVTWQMVEPLKKIYSLIPEPKAVLAVGACAVNGNVYKNLVGDIGENKEIWAPVETVIPVDVKVPGCAPRPEDIIAGAVKGLPKLMGAP